MCKGYFVGITNVVLLFADKLACGKPLHYNYKEKNY